MSVATLLPCPVVIREFHGLLLRSALITQKCAKKSIKAGGTSWVPHSRFCGGPGVRTMTALTRNWRLLASSGTNCRGLSTVADNGDTKLVKIPELGEVKGSSSVTAWTQRKFYQFLGIRYAEPPVGKLRFKVRATHNDMSMRQSSLTSFLPCPGSPARQAMGRCLRCHQV